MNKEEIHKSLVHKLHPRRFTNMSGKLGAIIGYLLDEEFTSPSISGLTVTSDGFLLAQRQGDIGCNDFLGTYSELERNLENLLNVLSDELTEEEKDMFNVIRQQKIHSFMN